MTKKEYKEAMSKIKVSPKLREKLLDTTPAVSNKRNYGKLCVSFALCAVLIGCIVSMIPTNKSGNTEKSYVMRNEENLKPFTLGEIGVGGGGIENRGFQDNPITQWQNIKDTALPVYKNLYNEKENGNKEVDKKPLKKIALDVASYLNEDVEFINDNSNTSVMYENENLSISVYYNRDITIFYNHAQFYKDEKDLLEKFGPWLGKNVSISPNELGYHIYLNEENPVDNLVHYTYKNISIGVENHQYSVVHIKNTDLSTCLGYYPIISIEEAKEKVERGEYVNPNQNIMYTQEDIQNLYLMYKETLFADAIIPYYQCILNDGQVVYVPAVDEKYIEDF